MRKVIIPDALKVHLRRNPTGKKAHTPGKKKRINAKAKLLAAQGGMCGICGEVLVDNITLDHTFCGGFGFFNTGNMTVAHYDCNHEKGSNTPTGCEMIWLMVANTCLTYYPSLGATRGDFWSYADDVTY